MTDFKPGEKVLDAENGDTLNIVDGPFPAYSVETSGGLRYVFRAERLQTIPPADPPEEAILYALLPTIPNAERRQSAARAILAALDAMPKTEPAKVRDSDGDIWERNCLGLWDLTTSDHTADKSKDYREVDHLYGPLTPIS